MPTLGPYRVCSFALEPSCHVVTYRQVLGCWRMAPNLTGKKRTEVCTMRRSREQDFPRCSAVRVSVLYWPDSFDHLFPSMLRGGTGSERKYVARTVRGEAGAKTLSRIDNNRLSAHFDSRRSEVAPSIARFFCKMPPADARQNVCKPPATIYSLTQTPTKNSSN